MKSCCHTSMSKSPDIKAYCVVEVKLINIPTRRSTLLFYCAKGPRRYGLLITEDSQSLRRTTLGRNPLDYRSTRRRDLYLTTNNTQKGTSMPSVGLEPTIPTSERQQNHVLHRAASGIFLSVYCRHITMKRNRKWHYGCHNSRCPVTFLLRNATIDSIRTSPSLKRKVI